MDFPKRIQQMFSKKSDAKENVAKENFANEVEICYLWNFFIRPYMVTKKGQTENAPKDWNMIYVWSYYLSIIMLFEIICEIKI